MSGLATLPSRDLDKLQKIAGLLGSDSEGERANAALMGTRLLGGHGITWRDALTPALPRHSAPPIPVSPMRRHAQQAAYCLAFGEYLTAWEREFCSSLSDRRDLSAKQSGTLAGIVAKVERQRARAGAYE